MEDDGEQFSLRWNNFHSNLSSGFQELFEENNLVDVTLACEGQYVQAHRAVLTVCSPYFKELFKVNPNSHPIIILKDVNFTDLSSILQFMYKGEVNVKQDDLNTFLKTAEVLKVKGLTGDNNKDSSRNVSQLFQNTNSSSPAKKRKLVETAKVPIPAPQPKNDVAPVEPQQQSVEFLSIAQTQPKEEHESYIEEDDDEDHNYSSHDMGDESLDLESQICMESGQGAMRTTMELEGGSSHSSFQGAELGKRQQKRALEPENTQEESGESRDDSDVCVPTIEATCSLNIKTEVVDEETEEQEAEEEEEKEAEASVSGMAEAVIVENSEDKLMYVMSKVWTKIQLNSTEFKNKVKLLKENPDLQLRFARGAHAFDPDVVLFNNNKSGFCCERDTFENLKSGCRVSQKINFKNSYAAFREIVLNMIDPSYLPFLALTELKTRSQGVRNIQLAALHPELLECVKNYFIERNQANLTKMNLNQTRMWLNGLQGRLGDHLRTARKSLAPPKSRKKKQKTRSVSGPYDFRP